MKSLSKLLLTLTTLFFATNLFAQTENELQNKTEFYLSAEACIHSLVNYPENVFCGNVGCTADFEQFEICALTCFEKNLFDFSASCLYVPLITNIIDLGANVIVHTETEYKTYVDIDILLGGYAALSPSPHFILDLSLFYFQKYTHIYVTENKRPWFMLNNFAFDLDFRFPVNDFFNLGLEIASFNKTKFNSFFTPFITLYVNYDMFKNITLNFSTQLNYIDMFTLSGNLANICVACGIDWRLK